MLRKTTISGLIAATMLTPIIGVATGPGVASASPAGPTTPSAADVGPAPAAPSSSIAKKRKRIVISRSECRHRFGTVRYSKWYARKYMALKYGWGSAQFSALDRLWYRESNWLHLVGSVGGAYGIPQALPGSKMSSAGADWRTNPETQIRWGLRYIKSVYGSPTRAYGHWGSNNWY